MVLKQVQVYCCTPSFINIPVAAGLVKVTSWSPKLISAVISAKSEQWLAAALCSNDFNHAVLAVEFTLPMSLISNYIYSMLYLYRTKLLSYWASIRAFCMQAVFKCIHVLGTAAWKVKTSVLGLNIKYDDLLAFHSKQNMVWNRPLGAEGKLYSWKGDFAVFHSWKRCFCITHWMSSIWIHFQYKSQLLCTPLIVCISLVYQY